MKIQYKYFLLLISLAFLFGSCNQDVQGTLFDANNKEVGFSFKSSVQNIETDKSDDNVIRIPIYKVFDSANTINVSCQFYSDSEKDYVDEDPNGIFRFTTPKVIFINNSNVAYAQVSYSKIGDLGVTDKYQFKLKLENNISYGGIQETNVTVNRKLTFSTLGIGTFYDEFLFYETYNVEIQKAAEANVYRVMDPFSKGLVAEDYVKNGWYTKPARYIQIEVKEDNTVRFDEFNDGMYFQERYVVYGVNPSERTEFLETDLSEFSNSFDGETFSLYPFYYIKGYGFFECKPMIVTLPKNDD